MVDAVDILGALTVTVESYSDTGDLIAEHTGPVGERWDPGVPVVEGGWLLINAHRWDTYRADGVLRGVGVMPSTLGPEPVPWVEGVES